MKEIILKICGVEMNKKELHKKVFAKEINSKLLCVNVNAEAQPYTLYEAMKDPQKAIANAENAFKYTKQVESDGIPFIESNFLEVLVPSIFEW